MLVGFGNIHDIAYTLGANNVGVGNMVVVGEHALVVGNMVVVVGFGNLNFGVA